MRMWMRGSCSWLSKALQFELVSQPASQRVLVPLVKDLRAIFITLRIADKSGNNNAMQHAHNNGKLSGIQRVYKYIHIYVLVGIYAMAMCYEPWDRKRTRLSHRCRWCGQKWPIKPQRRCHRAATIAVSVAVAAAMTTNYSKVIAVDSLVASASFVHLDHTLSRSRICQSQLWTTIYI